MDIINCKLGAKLHSPCLICLQPAFPASENGIENISLKFLLKHLKLFENLPKSLVICEKCQMILQGLSGLGRCLEKMQLEMDYLLEVILKKVLSGDDSKLRNDVSSIRQAIIERCDTRIRLSRPRIMLKRLDPSMLSNRDEPVHNDKLDDKARSLDTFSDNHPSDLSDDDELNEEMEHSKGSADTKMTTSKNKEISTGRIKCSKCPTTFRKRCYLTEHMKNVHLKLNRFKCDMCDKSFPRRFDLKKHKATPHKPISKNLQYPCDICDKSFEFPDHLETHKRFVHTDRKFVCGTCGKGFKTKQGMNRHVLGVHEKQRFPCKVPGCKTTAAYPDFLLRHYQMQHPDYKVSGGKRKSERYTTITENPNVKIFECNICKKHYDRRSTVLLHWRTSHGKDIKSGVSENQSLEGTNLGVTQEFATESEKDEIDGNSIGIKVESNEEDILLHHPKLEQADEGQRKSTESIRGGKPVIKLERLDPSPFLPKNIILGRTRTQSDSSDEWIGENNSCDSDRSSDPDYLNENVTSPAFPIIDSAEIKAVPILEDTPTPILKLEIANAKKAKNYGGGHPKAPYPINSKFPCGSCDKVFNRSDLLLKHRQQVHVPKRHSCDVCKAQFKRKAHLDLHKRRVHQKLCVNPKRSCEVTGCTMTYFVSLRSNHYRINHPELDPPTSKKRLKFPFKSNTINGKACVECHVCGKIFENPTYLRRHRLRMHRPKGFKCLDCGYEFRTAKELASHRQRKKKCFMKKATVISNNIMGNDERKEFVKNENEEADELIIP